MRHFTTLSLFVGIFLLFSAAPHSPIYQVISSHPHDVSAFAPYVKTVSKSGRLWLVRPKKNIPPALMKNFRPVGHRVIRHYPFANEKMLSRSLFIQTIINRVNKESIRNDVEFLASFTSRFVGTSENQKATSELKSFFEGLNLKVSQHCYRPDACSIVADRPGRGSTRDVIMLMAHFDSVGKKFAGADDNASGVAVMMEVARVLKHYANHKTIRFFATNGEETGLNGAKHYTEVLKKSGEINQIKLAINMDMVGYNSNGVVELETDSQYEDLARWFGALAKTYTVLESKITIGAWGSDHVPFIKSNVPTLLTIEDWNTKTPCYHLECDKPDTLNYDYAAEIAKLNMAAILTKDLNL